MLGELTSGPTMGGAMGRYRGNIGILSGLVKSTEHPSRGLKKLPSSWFHHIRKMESISDTSNISQKESGCHQLPVDRWLMVASQLLRPRT